MRLVLELKHLSDLEVLLPLLKRLDIAILQEAETPPAKEKLPPPLSKHIGVLPSLDVAAYEEYLDKTRAE